MKNAHHKFIHTCTGGGGCHAKCQRAHHEQIWGSVSCPRTLQQAVQRNGTSDLPITRLWLYPLSHRHIFPLDINTETSQHLSACIFYLFTSYCLFMSCWLICCWIAASNSHTGPSDVLQRGKVVEWKGRERTCSFYEAFMSLMFPSLSASNTKTWGKWVSVGF